MITYLALNIAFVAVTAIALRLWRTQPSRRWWLVLGMLLLLTAVFDSFIIAAGIVGYDATKILGLYIGKAPIEDFFYAILAAVMIPALWRIMDKKS